MGGDHEEDGSGEGRPSRRELIRRGAIVLGLSAWTVPLIQRARHSGSGGNADVDAGPQEIGVQAITATCVTCVVECGAVTVCGSTGVFDCFCAPQTYPPGCGCFSDVFCDVATPCSAGCPPGYACAQGCCAVPVCLPPCTDPPLAAARLATPSTATVAHPVG